MTSELSKPSHPEDFVIQNVQPFQGYRTSDGALFKEIKDALRHERVTCGRTAIRSYASRLTDKLANLSYDNQFSRAIVDFFVQNAEGMAEAFSDLTNSEYTLNGNTLDDIERDWHDDQDEL